MPNHVPTKRERAANGVAIISALVTLVALVVLASVALQPRPELPPPQVLPDNSEVIGAIAAVKQANDKRFASEQAESAKIERELSAIRSSLDHVTVRVHLGAGCCR